MGAVIALEYARLLREAKRLDSAEVAGELVKLRWDERRDCKIRTMRAIDSPTELQAAVIKELKRQRRNARDDRPNLGQGAPEPPRLRALAPREPAREPEGGTVSRSAPGLDRPVRSAGSNRDHQVQPPVDHHANPQENAAARQRQEELARMIAAAKSRQAQAQQERQAQMQLLAERTVIATITDCPGHCPRGLERGSLGHC